MLHYESLQRCHTFMGERLRRCQRHFSHMAAGASAGAAIALLVALPLVVGQVLVLLAAGLTIWTASADYLAKVARAVSLATNLSHAAREIHSLWAGLDELGADEARQAWKDLDARVAEVTRDVPPELLGYRSLQDRADEETYRHWSGAAAGTKA